MMPIALAETRRHSSKSFANRSSLGVVRSIQDGGPALDGGVFDRDELQDRRVIRLHGVLSATPTLRLAVVCLLWMIAFFVGMQVYDPSPVVSQEHLVAPELEIPVPAEVLEDATVEEVWMVSSRGISCPSDDLTGLKFYERVDEQWVDTPAEDFHDRLIDDRLNMLFVHGNRTNIQYASLRGLQAYQSFVRDQNPGVPTRYIIWAWPSEQMAGPIKDFRIKANRANQEGRLFGSFLSRFPSESQLSLIAYSYGSRIVLGGMQLLSGQPLLGRRLDLQEGFNPPSMRVTLIAAAAGNSSLLPRRQYGDAYDLMDRLLLINNTSDRALKLYRWLDRRSKISALGRGIAGRSMLADGGARIVQRDFANEIGHEHSLLGYFRSPRIRALVKEQIFWIEEEPADATTISIGSTSRRR